MTGAWWTDAMNDMPIRGAATKMGPPPGSTAMRGGDPISLKKCLQEKPELTFSLQQVGAV